MRHRVYGRKLSRNKDQRVALFKSLVRALVISEKIETTESKAKAIKGLVDKLVNQAKSPTTARFVRQFLIEKDIHEKLISQIAPRLGDRTSGYTSLVRVGKRAGDGVSIMRMSFVEGTGKQNSEPKEQDAIAGEVIEDQKEVKIKKQTKLVESNKTEKKGIKKAKTKK